MKNIEELFSIFEQHDLFLVFISLLIGIVIGAEREYHNKTAGLRTVILVSMGSCIFTILSYKMATNDTSRIAANIVTGIGFLGAGTIFKDDNKISGLTTACTIWVTAALGMCIGSDNIFLGVFGALIVLIVLLALARISQWIEKRNISHVYKVSAPYSDYIISDMEKLFKEYNLYASTLLKHRKENRLTIHWKLAGDTEKHAALTKYLLSQDEMEIIVI